MIMVMTRRTRRRSWKVLTVEVEGVDAAGRPEQHGQNT